RPPASAPGGAPAAGSPVARGRRGAPRCPGGELRRRRRTVRLEGGHPDAKLETAGVARRGADRGQRRRSHPHRAAMGRRRGLRRRVGAGGEGPGPGPGLHRRGPLRGRCAVSTAPGRFGPYGGRYVPETLIPALDALAEAWASARVDPAFRARLAEDLRDWAGRPTPLTFA